MAATVQASYYGASASEPAGVSAETGIKMNREDSQSGSTPTQIPPATGTNYSWYKMLALQVTGAAATVISNRKVGLAASPSMPTGVEVYFKGSATYVQATNANRPADVTSAPPNTPAGYTLLSTTSQVYDSQSLTANSGRNGNFCYIVLALDSTYAAGGGAATLPNLLIYYDEA